MFGESLLYYRASLEIIPVLTQVAALDDIGMRDAQILTQDKIILWKTTDNEVFGAFENAIKHQLAIYKGVEYDKD